MSGAAEIFNHRYEDDDEYNDDYAVDNLSSKILPWIPLPRARRPAMTAARMMVPAQSTDSPRKFFRRPVSELPCWKSTSLNQFGHMNYIGTAKGSCRLCRHHHAGRCHHRMSRSCGN
ncbi:hypothetical protein V8E54_010703 [Elaphomyces granulatus]